MIILLSPAKSLDFNESAIKKSSTPRMLTDSHALITVMRKKSAKEIGKLMSISDNLAQLNKDRYNSFNENPNRDQAKQAILSFKGDDYVGLENETLTTENLALDQEHVRILSGLYGVLRPLDMIQPYRLEMGTKLKTAKGKTLYDIWGDQITNTIAKDLKKTKTDVIIKIETKD
jgi:cytoplasmic iron level regulating protein YaaA (DUF328/UPF0246 family)